MRALIFTSLFFLVSCTTSIPPTFISGNNLSTEHGTARTESAFTGALEYCESIGMNIELVRTDCPWRCMSTYKCTEK